MLARSLLLARAGAARLARGGCDFVSVRGRALPLRVQRRRPLSRAFSARKPSPSEEEEDSDDESESEDESEGESEGHWSGVDPYYLSRRGVGIAGRVLSRMPDFFRWSEARAFSPRAPDEARSAMFVLTQFPRNTRVDLLEFRDACEQLVHALYERMYAERDACAAYFTDVTADAAAAAQLSDKAARQAARFAAGGRRVRLEQLSVNRVAIASVDYTSELLAPDERGDGENEWLEVTVHFDVTEHLLLASDGVGLDDRKSINTTFAWTFEANVTQPEAVEWWIAAVTPFAETSALLTAASASDSTE
ncbi:hypothetical protein PybrP1_012532 [[Pythium] brassicae (nom. inval.)]|nr:hypothetical protein PybrP1_012532 [[Pythium] brassicae (nom. inval.)]